MQNFALFSFVTFLEFVVEFGDELAGFLERLLALLEVGAIALQALHYGLVRHVVAVSFSTIILLKFIILI